jgi:hypothetical protein
MYPGQKKIAAFGLVLLLAIPLIFSVTLIVRQKLLQVNSRLKFDKEIIVTISVPEKDINWVKKGKEILVNGKYFDVKSFKQDGENILFTGYYDHKEDKIVGHLKKLMQQKKDSEGPVDQTAVKFVFFSVFSNCSEISYGSNWHFISTLYYSFDEILPDAPSAGFMQPPKI